MSNRYRHLQGKNVLVRFMSQPGPWTDDQIARYCETEIGILDCGDYNNMIILGRNTIGNDLIISIREVDADIAPQKIPRQAEAPRREDEMLVIEISYDVILRAFGTLPTLPIQRQLFDLLKKAGATRLTVDRIDHRRLYRFKVDAPDTFELPPSLRALPQ